MSVGWQVEVGLTRFMPPRTPLDASPPQFPHHSAPCDSTTSGLCACVFDQTECDEKCSLLIQN